MAGLLDYIGANGGALGSYLRDLDSMTARFVPAGMAPQNVQPMVDLPALLGRIDRATGTPAMGEFVSGLPKPDATMSGLTQQDFDGRFGAMQAPAQQPQAAPAPQMQPAAQAQQAFAMPDNTYQFGGQMVPAFGQAQAPVDEVSARKATPMPGPGTPPQEQRPSYQSELLGSPSGGGNKMMDFLDAIRPGFVGRYKSQQAQSETARGLYEIYRGQGMSPNEAASRAVIEARNPKIMEERMKPYTNMEQRLANDPNARPGGNAWETALKWKGDNKAAEVAAEKKASTQAEAQIALPGAAADFQQSMQTIEELRNHKGRGSIGWHGPTANIPADMLRGSEAYGAAKLEERLKSRVFGDQVKTMVGMGGLSNAEGSKITDAVASLDRGLKKDEYNRTLDFIQTAMKNGMDKIATKSGAAAPFGWKGNDGWQSVPMPGSNTQVRIRQVQ